MDVAVSLCKKLAAFKHGLSFGGKGSYSLLAALNLMAVDCPDIINKKSPPLATYPVPMFPHARVPLTTDHLLSPFGNEIPQPYFPLPPSVCEIDNNPLAINCPCSPFGNDTGLDINDLKEVTHLLDLPDEHQLNEIDDMVDLPDDTLFDAFRFGKDERFQNGFGLDMVSQGQYFNPVVHTARRHKAFLARGLWAGPSPAFHGLPYSYAHWRKGSRHHFAEVFVSTSIVACELQYKLPVQYVSAAIASCIIIRLMRSFSEMLWAVVLNCKRTSRAWSSKFMT
jgi:hypothetical protein